LEFRVTNIHEAFAAAYREQRGGHWEEARRLYRQILADDRAYPEVLYNLGIVCRKLGRVEEAVEAYQRALTLKPDFPEAENNLGNALRDLWRLDEAVAAFRRAVALKPDYAEAWNNLGATLKNQGQLEEAIPCFERTIELQPSNAALHSNYLYALHYLPGCEPATLQREARRWGERHAVPLRPFIPVHDHDRSPDRRLRIGYVSAAFCENCQSFFTVPLFSHHDHELFEIFGYSDVAKPDGLTGRLRAGTDAWRVTAGETDEQVARQVREDRIDILVDLTLHAAHNRLLVFARKPAPIQVTWLGYPGSTGMEAVDYRFTDPWLDPPGVDDAFYSERSLRLPDCFWCYDPLAAQPPVNDLPARRTGRVTFGCLNNFSKVNDGVLALWARVLRAVPESRLVLLAPPGEARRRALSVLDVDPGRVEFVDFQPRPLYLETYHRIDLCLDTFPCNGHTTSLDAYWMGVPTVTLGGRTAVSRAGISQASNLGLPELVARTPEEFLRIAVEWAGDLPRLARLRATLRERMTKSPLMDGARFTRGMESAYRKIWTEWCRG
jgi:protein O-GlcNAc transferase